MLTVLVHLYCFTLPFVLAGFFYQKKVTTMSDDDALDGDGDGTFGRLDGPLFAGMCIETAICSVVLAFAFFGILVFVFAWSRIISIRDVGVGVRVGVGL